MSIIMIKKHELSPGSVYDIGCGAGEIPFHLQQKMKRDVKFCGYDISPQAISISKPKENPRLRFYNEDFLTEEIASPDLVLLLESKLYLHFQTFKYQNNLSVSIYD